VLGPIEPKKHGLRKLYDFDQMMNSGHLAGYGVEDEAQEKTVLGGLKSLADPWVFAKKLRLKAGNAGASLCHGDGTTRWPRPRRSGRKPMETADICTAMAPSCVTRGRGGHLHEPALVFEPIHRVLFDIAPDGKIVEEFISFYGSRGATWIVSCPTG